MLDQESAQNRKYRLSLSGEFLVAGELLRRGMQAAVTYGNAKKADVIAIHGDKALFIEVKTTQQPRWIVGQRAPEASDQIWVLVFLPEEDKSPPEYYVLTGHELNAILAPIDELYFERYLATHGEPYGDRPGVCNLHKNLVKQHNGAWNKITSALSVRT
jgi:hypothetical protein